MAGEGRSMLTVPAAFTYGRVECVTHKFSLSTWQCLTFVPPLGVVPCEYPDKLCFSRNQKDCPTWCWNPHNRSSGQNTGMWRTDRRTEFLWLLQCEQCGYAVKNSALCISCHLHACMYASFILSKLLVGGDSSWNIDPIICIQVYLARFTAQIKTEIWQKEA